MIVRVFLWGLGDAKTGVDELRDRLEELEPLHPPSSWVWNEAAERFGVVLFAEDDPVVEVGLPEQLGEVRRLLGKDPDVFEEFDSL